MKKYSYKARDKSGKVVTGNVEAVSADAAARLIRKRDLIVIEVKGGRSEIFSVLSNFNSRVTPSDLTSFSRQLATMVNAGLPLVDALAILKTQSSKSIQPVAMGILADVEGGRSLSAALELHPKVFPPSYIALIRAGETGGVLDSVLVRLADNLEKEQEFKGKVKGALIYPIIIVIGMLIVSIIMIVFVIPKLTDLYTQFDAELPMSTKILTTTSDIVIKFWPVFIAIGGAIGWGYIAYKKTKKGRRRLDELSFKIPIIGDLKKEIILTELTRTLSLMVGTGVPILESLSVVSGVVDNVVISEALDDVGKQVEKGFPVAFAFTKHPEAFPYLLSQMISVGEETGKMDEVLEKVSHVFEINSGQKVKALITMIEPMVMIVLGIGVAFLVISIILPIYNLTSTL